MEHLGMAVDRVRNRDASRDVFGIRPKDLSTNVGAKNLSPLQGSPYRVTIPLNLFTRLSGTNSLAGSRFTRGRPPKTR